MTSLPTTKQANAATAVTTWEIDPAHSRAEFAVRHLMIANVRGTIPIKRATIVQDEVDVTRSRVEAELDLTGIHTGVGARDEHLRSGDFFDVENHPVMRFESTRIEKDGEGYRVHGDLSIRGTKRPVVLDMEIVGQGRDENGVERGAAVATTTLDRKDWGLTWNVALETGGVMVADKVKVTLELEAVKQ